MKKYGRDLMDKPRWLVPSKIDLVHETTEKAHCNAELLNVLAGQVGVHCFLNER